MLLLPYRKTMMTKKELKTRKNYLAHQIHNIREDYAGVEKEDMPQDVLDEISVFMTELKEVRTALGKE